MALIMAWIAFRVYRYSSLTIISIGNGWIFLCVHKNMTISNFKISLLCPDRTFTSSLNWLPYWLHCVALIRNFRRFGSQMERFQSGSLINILPMRAQPREHGISEETIQQTNRTFAAEPPPSPWKPCFTMQINHNKVYSNTRLRDRNRTECIVAEHRKIA